MSTYNWTLSPRGTRITTTRQYQAEYGMAETDRRVIPGGLDWVEHLIPQTAPGSWLEHYYTALRDGIKAGNTSGTFTI